MKQLMMSLSSVLLLSVSAFHFYRLFMSLSPPGSAGNSRSSTQMNSYSDSGYQEASGGYLGSQSLGKAELRMQHSFPGAGTGTLVRNARAEGQASAQVQPAPALTRYCCSQAQKCISKALSPEKHSNLDSIFFN